MGAAPSSIPNHEQTPVTDVIGDGFPTGCWFYLTNGADNFTTCLAVDLNGRANLKVIKDSPDRKWQVDYAWNDRSKIALKNLGTGKWLILENANYGSKTRFHGGQVFMYVYKTDRPNTFWLSTPQSPDCFFCAWDNVGGTGKDVLNLTSRNGQGLGKGNDLFNANGRYLEWQLEWTPEYEQWKSQSPEGQAAIARRKALAPAVGKAESGACCERCSDRCSITKEAAAEVEEFKGQYGDCKNALEEIHEREDKLDQAEKDLRAKSAAQNTQLRSLSERKADLEKREAAMKQQEDDVAKRDDALKQREIALDKKDHDLDARKNAVLAEEARRPPAQADKAAARKQKEEQVAHEEEVQKKTEQMQKARQKEQAESARLKAENAELQNTNADLKRKQEQSQAAGDKDPVTGEPAVDLEKVSLQADLEHALEMLAEAQRKLDHAQRPAAAATPGFLIAPPSSKMPPSIIGRPMQKMPESMIGRPQTTMPASPMIGSPRQQMPESIIGRPQTVMPPYSVAPPQSKMPPYSTNFSVKDPSASSLPQRLATPQRRSTVQRSAQRA